MENAAWEMQTRSQTIIENQIEINIQHKLGTAKYEHKSMRAFGVREPAGAGSNIWACIN